jgi:hypothetical protein
MMMRLADLVFHFRDDAILGLPVFREESVPDVESYGWLIGRRPAPEKALSFQLGLCCFVEVESIWWCGVEVDTRNFGSGDFVGEF